jgi:hypothetical protein
MGNGKVMVDMLVFAQVRRNIGELKNSASSSHTSCKTNIIQAA